MNLIFVVICSGYFEKSNIGETGVKLKDRLHIYRKHIREPEYQQRRAPLNRWKRQI